MPYSVDASPEETTRQEAIEWFLLLRQEDLSSEDLNAFAQWLAEDGSHVAAFAQAEQLFLEMSSAARQLKPPPACAPGQAAPPDSAAPVLSRGRGFWLQAGLALAAVWLLGVHLILPEHWRLLDLIGADYQTRIGEVRQIPLSDGSLAILDTQSAIEVDLQGPSRRLRLLHGRVHVQVKRDPDRPFEVASQQLVVRALGTAFDVRQTGGVTEVTVQEHAVDVRLAGQDARDTHSVTVREGQRLSFREGGHLPHPETIPLDQASAWRQGRLLVSDQPLTRVIGELERYRVGRIFLGSSELQSLRVSGLFKLDPPEQSVNSLCSALGLRETWVGPWWVILHR